MLSVQVFYHNNMKNRGENTITIKTNMANTTICLHNPTTQPLPSTLPSLLVPTLPVTITTREAVASLTHSTLGKAAGFQSCVPFCKHVPPILKMENDFVRGRAWEHHHLPHITSIAQTDKWLILGVERDRPYKFPQVN